MKCFGEKIRNYHCKVVLLDDQELIQEIQSTSLGQELLETIFKHLNLIETSYFGLRFIDRTEQTHWLDPGKRTISQLSETDSYTLYFGVKFYAADPCKLVEEITRYQFFLQVKQDILQGRLPVPNELAAEIFAYAVQSELGDYDSRRYGTGYISEFQFISNQSQELETKIADLHKTMIGQVPAVAELNYLEKVKWLEMYGVDLHPVLGEDNTDYFLGLTPAGVIVLRNKTKVGNYFWPRISKLNQKGKYFMLRVKTKNSEEQTYGFETPSKAACKHLWKCATEHHAFFRLVQVAPTSKSHSLNTRFRDSSRSDSSVRRRAQPQFVRTPSRRYQRRPAEGAQDDSELKNESSEAPNQNGFKRTVAVPQPVDAGIGCQGQMRSLPEQRSDSPTSIRSAPWPKPPKQSIPSPKSVRSAGVGSSHNSNREKTSDRHHHRSRKRSGSAESNSSCDSPSRRKHRHRRRRGSDAESEASRQSGRSHGKRRHRKSGSKGRESGSESDNCSRKHKHRHRRESKKYELVDSEAQWKEVQNKQAQLAVQQAAVIQKSANASNGLSMGASSGHASGPTPRKSGYANSGGDTASEASNLQNRRRNRRHSNRSTSPDKRLPTELKRHLDFQLIDTEGMSAEQRMEIPYLKVETSQANAAKNGKVRHSSSVKSNRSVTLAQPQHPGPINPDSNPGIKMGEFGIFNSDSPPPPYSPPPSSSVSNGVSRPAIPQKPVIGSLRSSLGSQMKPGQGPNQNLGNGNGASQSRTPAVHTETNRRVAVAQSPQNQRNPNPHQALYNPSTVSQKSVDAKPVAPNHHELGLPVSFHPSPSESPDSQKVDSHHENSDSGLGTDHHEYYKTENFSSLGYEVISKVQKDTQPSSKISTLNPRFNWPENSTTNTKNNTNGELNQDQKRHYWSNLSKAETQIRAQAWESMKAGVSTTPSLNHSGSDTQVKAEGNLIHEISTEL